MTDTQTTRQTQTDTSRQTHRHTNITDTNRQMHRHTNNMGALETLHWFFSARVLDFWTSGVLDFLTSGLLHLWNSGVLDFWSCEFATTLQRKLQFFFQDERYVGWTCGSADLVMDTDDLVADDMSGQANLEKNNCNWQCLVFVEASKPAKPEKFGDFVEVVNAAAQRLVVHTVLHKDSIYSSKVEVLKSTTDVGCLFTASQSKDATFQKAERQRGREVERQRGREVQLFKNF